MAVSRNFPRKINFDLKNLFRDWNPSPSLHAKFEPNRRTCLFDPARHLRTMALKVIP